NAFDVQTAGVTMFHDHTSYALAGGTFAARSVLLENVVGIPDALCGRIYFNISGQAFDETINKRIISNYSAELGYNLTPPAPSSLPCGRRLEEPPATPANAS